MEAHDPADKRGFLAEYARTLQSTCPAGRRVWLGAAIYLIRTLGFSVAFPLFAKARGYSPGEIGLLIAATQFSLFFFGVPITIYGGRGHARKLLAAGPFLAAFGVGGLLALPGDTLWPTLFCALLAGSGGASFWVLGDPLLVATTPVGERTRVFALKFFLLTVGIVLGGGLGGWIPGGLETAGLSVSRALAVTMGFFAVCDLLATVTFASIPAYEDGAVASPKTAVGGARFGGMPWAIMFALTVPEIGMAFGHNGIRPFISLFFTESQWLSASFTGTALAALGIVAGAGTLFAPRLASRFGSIPAIALLRATGALAVLFCFAGLGFPAVFGLMCFYYFAVDGTEALLIAEAMNRVAAANRTVFSGMYAMAWSMTATAASLISGLIQDQRGGAFGLAFAVCAGGYFFSVIWLLAVFRRLPLIHVAEAVSPPPLAQPEPA